MKPLYHMLAKLFLILFITIQNAAFIKPYQNVGKFPLIMPNVYPNRDELYLCTPVKIVPKKNYYVVGFEPAASMNMVHHMLLFGCSEPGTEENVWDCGEMAETDKNSGLKTASPCSKGSSIIYAWARNASKLELPANVAFQLGEGTGIAYLVLQVHYAKKFPQGMHDSSGIDIIYTEEKQNKLAGVVLLGTGGDIPPHNVTSMESSCELLEDNVIHPFAFRTHTHSLGRLVSGFSIHRNMDGTVTWKHLGSRNPMTPQMFYPIQNSQPIMKGDILAARCVMDSQKRDRLTSVGPTNKDEMCNFYLMYYVDEGYMPLRTKYCMTEGPPYYNWATDPLMSDKLQFFNNQIM